jgi:PGF-pre-PGF domain-containing protein
MMNRTKLMLSLSVLFLITGIFNASAADITLDFPSNISGGQMFDVSVIIDPEGEHIAGAQLDIEYNISSIFINSITEGNLLRQSGINTVFSNGTTDNSIGKAVKIYGAILGKGYVTTPGIFIIINATSIGSTNASDIDLTNVLVVDPEGKQIYPIPTTTPIPTSIVQTQISSMASGGAPGGGGSGGASGENYTNIEFTEKYDKYIFKDVTTSYRFKKIENPIAYVNITGNTNSVETTTLVEGLYDTSTLVKIPSPGLVYKNINIWVGTFGYATPKNIKNAEIIFKVPLAWMEENKIDPETIVMMGYDNDWQPLPTIRIGVYDEGIIYEASTIGFYPFAITGKKAEHEIIYGNYGPYTKHIVIESWWQEIYNDGISPLFIAAFVSTIIIIVIAYNYGISKYLPGNIIHTIKQKKIVKTTRKKLSSIIRAKANDDSIKNIAVDTKISESSINKARAPTPKDHEPIQIKKTSRKKKEIDKSTGKPEA